MTGHQIFHYCLPAFLAGWMICGSARLQAQSSGESESESLVQYRIDARHTERPDKVDPVSTQLPLELKAGDHIALIGNTLFDRAQYFGCFEALLHQSFPEYRLVVRTLAWSADEIDLRPRPISGRRIRGTSSFRVT